MKIIIVPDSFKGTMSAIQVCDIMASAVSDIDCNAEIITIPVADGGEGSIDAFGCEKTYIEVTGVDNNNDRVRSYYGIMNGTAVIEMATCARLPLTKLKNPELTTTYGVGELINHALNNGYRDFIIGLGGSATNDGGCGMAAALGMKFLDFNENEFIPVGGTLKNIAHIDISGIDKRIHESNFITMCDIDNPLYGKNGAAYVFSPQKGADADMVKRLDDGLIHLGEIIRNDLNIDVSLISGGGAAGGMGAGMSAFLGGKLKSGIDVVLDAVGFDGYLHGADLIISGEGRFDDQSIHGKVVDGISRRIKVNNKNIPFIVIAGSVDDNVALCGTGITAVFSIQRTPLPFEDSVLRSEKDLYNTVKNIINMLYKIY